MSLVGSLVIGQLLAEELRSLSCGGVNSKVRGEVNDQVSERTVREGRESGCNLRIVLLLDLRVHSSSVVLSSP